MFTLIIPYRNREKYLFRTLESIRISTVVPAKIILVDNGSTDHSESLCRQYASKHPNLPIAFLSEPHEGACIARNTALCSVTTEWVYFFDSDDELEPSYFQEVLSVIQKHEDCEVVACATKMVFSDGKEKIRSVQYSNSVVDQILSGELATQGMFFRTSFLRRIGAWNQDLPKWNDWELGVRVMLNEPNIHWLHGKAYHRIYQHQDSLTGNGFSSSFRSILKSIETVAFLVKANPAARMALACRCVFLAAQLYKENDRENSGVMKTFAASLLPPKHIMGARLFLKILYRYVLYGGRGSWYIAKKVIDQSLFS